jgi:early secretory antigenic target protein ESAT-6
MSEQVWNFAAIDGGIASLRGHAATIKGQCDDLDGACGRGVALWEGTAGAEWAIAQQRLNARAQEYQLAMTDFINASEEAKLQMMQQESINQSSFA